MPEASVHKDSEPLLGKDKVRPAENRVATSPTRNTLVSQYRHKREFRALVSLSTNASHDR
jgi:hypothetical protein